MTSRIAFVALPLLGAVLATSVAAQARKVPVEGILVRPVGDVSTLERLQIAVTHALIPGSKVIAPLYAYDPSAFRLSEQRSFDGPAAIVVDRDSEGIRAFYYPTIVDAINAMDKDSKFQNKEVKTFLATTYPLEGEFEEKGRYLSRDIEGIEAQLQQRE